MTPIISDILLRENFSPPKKPGLQAWYDVSDLSSMLNASGAKPSSGDAIKLVGDKSGNSATNVLCLNGVAGNFASTPNAAALQITGDIDIRFYGALPTWQPAAAVNFINKDDASTSRDYNFFMAATGTLKFLYSTDGSTTRTATSSAANAIAAFAASWVRCTYVSATGKVDFYTSVDGSTWTALGVQQTITSGAIHSSTQQVRVGQVANSDMLTGQVYRAQIYNGIAGTLVFDADFAGFAKLAATGAERSSNAATVTINTSGDLGARICGARDLYQGTGANQPILTIAGSGNILTFNGTSRSMKASAFSLAQPETTYFLGSQVAWTAGHYLFDGNSTTTLLVRQKSSGGATPDIELYPGSSLLGPNSGFVLATQNIVSAIFNGASSMLRINRAAPIIGGTGSVAGNGFTLAADGAGLNMGNITVSEVIVRSFADPQSTQDQFIQYLGRKWAVLGV